MKKLILAMTVLAGLGAHAQAPQFRYKITYNTSFCEYEARAVLVSGSFNGAASTRIPSSTNFTIVVPASYSNANFVITSLLPVGKTWLEGNGVDAPNANPSYDYHPVSITGGGLANAYPAMNVNDEIVLFRFAVAANNCGSGMRPFINGGTPSGDPTSTQFLNAGDPGIDISNAFQIAAPGSPNNYYIGNLATVTPPAPVISSITPVCGATSLTLNASATAASACNGSISYAWSAPATVSPTSSTSNPVVFSSTTPSGLDGTYSLSVTDSLGCISNLSKTYSELCASPLPVTLSAFDAVAKHENGSCKVQVTWTAATEQNAAYYTVQRKGTGQWETVGREAASGRDSGTNLSYSFNDNKPLAGTALYRLAITDQDGSTKYSNIKKVLADCDVNGGIKIYPNPANQYITVEGFNKHAAVSIRIVNMMGQIISVTRVADDAALQVVNVSALASASYMVQVVEDGVIRKTQSLVKQ